VGVTPFSGAGIGGLFSKFGQTGEKGFSEMMYDVLFLLVFVVPLDSNILLASMVAWCISPLVSF
jgi:hypothetical protein